MKLLEIDEEYLTSKQFEWEFIPGDSEGYLIIKDYPTNSDHYQSSKTNILIRIPTGYNMAALDCFYADPPVKLKENGANPQAADQVVTLNGKPWQQFSRHWVGSDWRPGVDGVQTMLAKVSEELQH